MKQILRHIPNTITTLNLISGILSVMFAIDGHLIWAGVFICLAALFDFLDGFAARLLHAYSEIGKQLDSLADLVSFGFAPGAILFTLLEFALFGKNQPLHEISAGGKEWLILFSSFLLPVFGAIRLARFNTNTSGENFFRGLPIPANGILWASLGLMTGSPEQYQMIKHLYSPANLVILGIFMSGLMVLSLPMFNLKIKELSFSGNWYRYLFASAALGLVLVFTATGVSMAVFLYIILNVIFYLIGIKY